MLRSFLLFQFHQRTSPLSVSSVISRTTLVPVLTEALFQRACDAESRQVVTMQSLPVLNKINFKQVIFECIEKAAWLNGRVSAYEQYSYICYFKQKAAGSSPAVVVIFILSTFSHVACFDSRHLVNIAGASFLCSSST